MVTIASSAAEKPLTHQEGDYAQNADQTRLSWCARQRTRTLLSEPTIYLIPECATGVEVDQVLRELCEEIFSEQLAGWFNDETTWPQDRGFEVFCHWFDFQHHSMLVDLCDDPLILEWTEDFGISLLCENRTIWFWRATATHGVAPDPGTKSCFRHTAAK